MIIYACSRQSSPELYTHHNFTIQLDISGYQAKEIGIANSCGAGNRTIVPTGIARKTVADRTGHRLWNAGRDSGGANVRQMANTPLDSRNFKNSENYLHHWSCLITWQRLLSKQVELVNKPGVAHSPCLRPYFLGFVRDSTNFLVGILN